MESRFRKMKAGLVVMLIFLAVVFATMVVGGILQAIEEVHNTHKEFNPCSQDY